MTPHDRSTATAIDSKERRRYPRDHQPKTAEVLIQHAEGDVVSQAVVINSSLRLLGMAAAILLAAGWHFRNVLWHLWSLS